MKKVAMIFPGQGSQSFGMGKEFYENNKKAVEMVEAASDRLSINFKDLLFEENQLLGETEYTQPAILLVSCIALSLFKSRIEVVPEYVLGHSLGEFTALVASGAINYLDAVELVHKRGLFMKDACEGKNAGMMALVGLEDKIIEDTCKELQSNGRKIWPANYNMNGQLVLAGLKKDLEDSSSKFKELGAKRVVILDMSVASHCELLQSASENLEPYLESFISNTFNFPIISNVRALPYQNKTEAVQLLTQQLISPVLYKQSILTINNIDYFIEFGHGAVLKGINKKITKIPTLNVNNMLGLEDTLEKLYD